MDREWIRWGNIHFDCRARPQGQVERLISVSSFSLEHKGGLSSQDLRSTRSLTRAFSLSNAIAGDEPGGRELISCKLHSFLILQIEAYHSSGPIVQPFLSGAWSWSITEMR